MNKNTKDKDVYFRSLLELKYLIQLEENPDVFSITMEPFHIALADGSTYTPDILVNEKTLIELKPISHKNWRKDSQNNRFELEMDGAKRYCENHNLEFKLVYDIDINFESNKYKRYLINHLEIINKYNIRFNKPLKTH